MQMIPLLIGGKNHKNVHFACLIHSDYAILSIRGDENEEIS